MTTEVARAPQITVKMSTACEENVANVKPEWLGGLVRTDTAVMGVEPSVTTSASMATR